MRTKADASEMREYICVFGNTDTHHKPRHLAPVFCTRSAPAPKLERLWRAMPIVYLIIQVAADRNWSDSLSLYSGRLSYLASAPAGRPICPPYVLSPQPYPSSHPSMPAGGTMHGWSYAGRNPHGGGVILHPYITNVAGGGTWLAHSTLLYSNSHTTPPLK